MNKRSKKKFFIHFINVVTIALIIECFLCTFMAVQMHARNDCLDRIEETNKQAVAGFVESIDRNYEQLQLFADILATNTSNPDMLLSEYMENFCITQDFTSVCVYRKNGTHVSYGEHPHLVMGYQTDDVKYISEVISTGEMRHEKYIYQSTPVIRNGELVGVLYGFITLDVFEDYISSTIYNGRCQFCVVDGDTGEYLVDEYHKYSSDGKTEIPLGVLDGSRMEGRDIKTGYSIEDTLDDIRAGRSGYIIFKSKSTSEWHYTYYMPIGFKQADGEEVNINNWSMQLTIDEPTAFKMYNSISMTVLMLMIAVIVLIVVHVLALMIDNVRSSKRDKAMLHRSDYINTIQAALISAHSDPDFVDKALKMVANEVEAETAMLLMMQGKVISHAQFWPAKDRENVLQLVGLNARDSFPTIYDWLTSNQTVFYDVADEDMMDNFNESSKVLFTSMSINNMILVPILDVSHTLKGILIAVNTGDRRHASSMLECVTGDFFMAIANLENHNIIKDMGAKDYMTGVKNRNSYESELQLYETAEADNMWCVFVDANGLHEINNREGHKAGDIMLCTIANVLKTLFGNEHTYRLGGDEFVAFVPNSTHEKMMSYKHRMIDHLADKGYYVSIGFEGAAKNENGIFNIEKVVATAETYMYREKKQFYEKNNLSEDRLHLPK